MATTTAKPASKVIMRTHSGMTGMTGIIVNNQKLAGA